MLDPSEIDRIVESSGADLTWLVDWKNRLGDPFHLRATPKDGGLYDCEIDFPEPLRLTDVVPLVHGEYETASEEETGIVTYESRPGNTLGQMQGPDGRPAFAVAFDITTLDEEGRPLLKVYFGSAAGWYVQNEYHQKWAAVRDVRKDLEPGKKPRPPQEAADEDVQVEGEPGAAPKPRRRGRRGGRRRRGGRGGQGGGAASGDEPSGGGRSGGRARGRGRGGAGGGARSGGGEGGASGGGEGGGSRRRGRRGGRRRGRRGGRGRGGGGNGASGGES